MLVRSKEGILVSRRVMNERGPPAAALAGPRGEGQGIPKTRVGDADALTHKKRADPTQ